MRRTTLALAGWVWLAAAGLPAQTPIPGPNVNMVSGTTWPGGDPNLQKQNEPSIAISTRNPLHLVAGANDYRTVDFAGLPFVDEEGVNHDAWQGLFKSFDGGATWQSTLLPGCPYTHRTGEADPCANSPLIGSGYTTAADPTVRAGTNGLFYYSFIAFDRNNKKNGAVAVARLIDDNNKQAPVLDESNGNGGSNVGKDPIRYLGTSIIDSNSGGQFNDKPYLAVDMPRAGALTCNIPATPAQSFPGGRVYVAYSIFLGNDVNIRSKIMFAASSDCGQTWRVQKLSEGSSINQGATVAIDPVTGAVWVAWRRFKNQSGIEPDSILVVKSVDGGATFTKFVEVVPGGIQPFDIGTLPTAAYPSSGPRFRTNAYPTMAVAGGTAYIAWAQRNTASESRIVISSSTDGLSWTAPAAVEVPVPAAYGTTTYSGHQFMPAFAYAGGKLMLVYYDLREDHTKAVYTPLTGNGYSESRAPLNTVSSKGPDDPVKVLDPAGSPSDNGLNLRHTLDVRLIQMTPPLAVTGLSSVRVSQYHYGARTFGGGVIEQLQFNPPNLKLFRKGQAPFIGDFIDLASVPFVPDGAGGWKYNTDFSNSVVFHAAWTDNRNVRPTTDVNKYAPPSTTAPTSRFDPTQNQAACVENKTQPLLGSQPGAMNQDVYTARIDQGIVTGALTNAKPLNIDRAFPFFVRNTGTTTKYFGLSLSSSADVSFKPITDTSRTLSLCVGIGAKSGISRVVFAKTNTGNTKAGIQVTVQEVNACPGGTYNGGLQSTISLNSDTQNPEIENATTPELFNPEIENPEIENPEIENPEIENPEIENPEIENPEIENPEIENPEIENPEIENPEIENPEIENPEIENVPTGTKVTDVSWKVFNRGSAAASYNAKLLLNGKVPPGVKTQLIVNKFYVTNTSKTGVCSLLKQSQTQTQVNIPSPKFYTLGDPNLINPEIENPDLTNATFSLGKGEKARITVRVVASNTFDAGAFFTQNVQPVVVLLAPNPGGVVVMPDLVVESLTHFPPNPTTADLITFTAVVRNIGGPAGPSTLEFRVGGETPGAPETQFAVPALAPGASYTVQRQRTLIAQNYRNTATADINNAVQEQNEVNNVRTDDYTVGSPPVFLATGSLAQARDGLSADLLTTGPLNGKVLVLGGYTGGFSAAASAELYDPTTGTFSPGGNMTTNRALHRTTKLSDGRIFISGGAEWTGSGWTTSNKAEIYDPATATFTATTAPMPSQHMSHATVRLADSTVLIIGGQVAAVDRFDPSNGTFTATPGLLSQRTDHGAVLLANGNVVVAGGGCGNPAATVPCPIEIYTPGSGSVVSGTFNEKREGAVVMPITVGPNVGRVFIAGGWNGTAVLNTTVIYNPADGSYVSGPAMNEARYFTTATTMPDGRILIVGSASSQLYDPVSNGFSLVNGPITPRTRHAAALLGNGRVLIVGGGPIPLASAELYVPNP